MTVEFSPFYKSHQLDELMPSTADQADWLNRIIASDIALSGYRDGVVLKKVEASFKHTTVELDPGMELKAIFEARVPGEEPRKKIYVVRDLEALPTAKSVFAVLYHKDVLAEDGESIESDWGVVAHLTSSLDVPEPIHPDTLIANHFHLSGGTSTQMSSEQFEKILGAAVLFWKNRVTAYTGSDIR